MVKFDQLIKPGETGHIELSVKIYKEWAGKKFTKRALVMTNDAKMARFMLTLSGTVKPL